MNNTAPIDRLTELEKWHTHMEAIESATDRLYKLIGSSPESEFMAAIGDMQMHYTALMSKVLQITPDWLEQWWLEDHLGTRPMWVEIDGQEHQIETVADLLKIADQDKNT